MRGKTTKNVDTVIARKAFRWKWIRRFPFCRSLHSLLHSHFSICSASTHTHTHHSLHCTQSVILYVMLTTLHRLLHKRRLNVIAVHSHDCSIRRERREWNRKKREVLLKGENSRGFAYQICLIYYVIHVRTIWAHNVLFRVLLTNKECKM